ncbi:MAG: PAS-domain containing protein, partial [Gammaproteobacteria bacterium]|nr:PAS-domain containing protein [Gammaproteobacteria bacterium]
TLNKVNTAVAVFGPDQRLRFANDAFVNLWGLTRDNLNDRPSDSEILNMLRDGRRLPEQADYRRWVEEWLEIYKATGTREESWHLPDGRSILVSAECHPTGDVTYVYEDRTEWQGLESRYNELIDVQRETLDNMHEGAALFGSDGRLKLYNPAFAEVWHLQPEQLVSEPHVDDVIAWCREMHHDDDSWDELKIAVTSVGDSRLALNGRLNRDDQSVIDYSTVPLLNGSTLLIYKDVTASTHIERALRERNEALLEADRLKSEFISHVSYQLRTPLTSIIGFSESLGMGLGGKLSAKQSEYANHIRTSSNTLLALIDDILDLATIDAGAMELTIEEIEIPEIVKSTAKLV